MEYRSVGKSGLKVSEIGLGTNSFGNRVDEQTSISVIEHALELGINFIDTAEMYAQGRSEEIVGRGIRGKRSQVVVATKFGYPTSIGPREQGGSRSYIVKAVDRSLKRLNTDYIDLCYFHYPDAETPIEESLRAMDDLVRSGKVRYIGCSNFAGWQLCEALWTSRCQQLERFIAVQSRYNLLDRSIERELVPCCQAYGVGVVPWGPLASGFLAGRFCRGEKIPKEARLADPPPIYQDVVSDVNFDKLGRVEEFAERRGHKVGEVAIAWLLSRPWLSSVVVGATRIEQVTQNVAASDLKLTADDLAELHTLI